MPRKRTREQRNYDFASIQIACMVELAHQVHPDVGFCESPNEVDILIGNIQIIGDWLDQLAGYAAGAMRGRGCVNYVSHAARVPVAAGALGVVMEL
jgi:hypothetical protein